MTTQSLHVCVPEDDLMALLVAPLLEDEKRLPGAGALSANSYLSSTSSLSPSLLLSPISGMFALGSIPQHKKKGLLREEVSNTVQESIHQLAKTCGNGQVSEGSTTMPEP